MRSFIKTALQIVAVAVIAVTLHATAFAANGTIIPGFQQSQWDLYDSGTNGPDVWNWIPRCGATAPANDCPYPVTVTDSQVTGQIWDQGSGWISLDCASSDTPDCANNGNFGVKNDGAGNLSGYAWGEGLGYISFWCGNDTVNQDCANNGNFRVTIDPATGEFDGLAWSENKGYVVFSCPGTDSGADSDSFPDTCVKTDWPNGTTNPPNSGGGGGGGGGYSSPDYCDNIPGKQSGIPGGYYASGGNCYPWPGNPIVPPVNPPANPGPGSSSGSGPSNPGNPNIPANPSFPVDPGIGGASSNPNYPPIGGPAPVTPQSPQMFALGAQLSQLLDSVLPLLGIIGLVSTVPGLITRFGNAFLTFVFLKRKTRGVVYDSNTKEPLDPAYVSVIDVTTGAEIMNQITDLQGRYGFVLPRGTYRLVANKTNYAFPSVKLAGKTKDEVYDNLYFGETFVIEDPEQLVTLNIPMDATGTDWNQQEKRRMNIIRYFTEHQAFWNWIFNILFITGFIGSVVIAFVYPLWFNIVLVGLYVVAAILQIAGFGAVTAGRITRNGQPLAHAIVRVHNANLNREVAHKVTSDLGSYYILVSKGDYYVTIEAKNPDGTYSNVYTSNVMRAGHGLINKSFDL